MNQWLLCEFLYYTLLLWVFWWCCSLYNHIKQYHLVKNKYWNENTAQC
jgi:hypothetical protein